MQKKRSSKLKQLKVIKTQMVNLMKARKKITNNQKIKTKEAMMTKSIQLKTQRQVECKYLQQTRRKTRPSRMRKQRKKTGTFVVGLSTCFSGF